MHAANVLLVIYRSFSRTNIDMITKRYNTDAIVWRTQLLCVCRLMSGEQTDVVSNSYTMYYSVISSVRKTGKDLYIHLVGISVTSLHQPLSLQADGLPM